MAWVALVLSFAMVVLGVMGLVSPRSFVEMAWRFGTPGGLYAAAALRLVLGVALVLAAPRSRAPGTIRVIGVVVVVAGLVTPLVGVDRARTVLDWWAAHGPVVIRAWAVIALVLGGGLAYALLPAVRRA